MGEVYLARPADAPGAPPIVVKLLHEHLVTDDRMRAMFFHEARLGSLLVHPNIARIHDYGEHEGVLYLTMEYVAGLALSSILRRTRGQIPLAVALHLTAEVANALGYAHKALGPDGEPLHVVHRDISPQNIMLGRDGSVKLIDFGVAKSAAQDYRTKTGVLKGKLAYMAPEQFRGHVSHVSDVFALGIILFETVSGRRLFRRNTEAETFAAILSDPVPPLGVHDEYDRVLAPVLERALARDPEARYADAHALADDIRAAAARLGVRGSPAEVANVVIEAAGTTRAAAPSHDVASSDPEGGTPSGLRVRSKDAWSDLSSHDGLVDDAATVSSESSLGAAAPAADPRPPPIEGAPTLLYRGRSSPGTTPPTFAAPPTEETTPPRRRFGVAVLLLAVVAAGAAVAFLSVEPLLVPRSDAGSSPDPPASTAAVPPEAIDEPTNVEPDVEADVEARPNETPTASTEPPDQPEPAVTATTEEGTVEPASPMRRAPSPRRPSMAAVAAAESGEGQLFVNTDPWTTVRLGSRNLGQTPINGATVPAGRHVLVLRESNGTTHRVPVRIAPNRATKRFIELR
jgi:serine/threonine-protein kinase